MKFPTSLIVASYFAHLTDGNVIEIQIREDGFYQVLIPRDREPSEVLVGNVLRRDVSGILQLATCPSHHCGGAPVPVEPIREWQVKRYYPERGVYTTTESTSVWRGESRAARLRTWLKERFA